MTADAELGVGLCLDSLRRLDDDEAVHARFCTAIDDATAVEGFDWQEIAGWTDNVSAVLHAIRPLARGRRSNVALKLAEHAIGRIADAIDKINEYDFRFYRLIERAQKIHLAAVKVARPDPVELARYLSGLDRTAGYMISSYSFTAYAPVLGTTGLAEYRRLIEHAWASLPPKTPTNTDGPIPGVYWHLRDILDHFAKADGDVDVRIALRTKYLAESTECVRLIHFCLEQGQPDAALRHAEEALIMYAGLPHANIARLAAKLLVERGRKAEAQLRLRNALNTADVGHGIDAMQIGGLCADLCAFGSSARDWVLTRLEARIEGADKKSQVAFADILLGLLLDEQMFEAAFNAARRLPCSLEVKQRVAAKIEETLPAQAIELYEDLVEWRLAKGNWAHYGIALDMLGHLVEMQGAREHQLFLSRLKQRFARRKKIKEFLDWALLHGMTRHGDSL